MAFSTSRISYATEADIPLLAEVVAQAYNKEAFLAFTVEDWPSTIAGTLLQKSRFVLKFANPQSKILKITDDISNEILGVTTITLKTGEQEPERDLTTIAASGAGLPPGLNGSFIADIMEGMKILHPPIGVKYYEIGQAAVAPKHQGKGLGTKLMNFCAHIADEANLPIYLASLPGSHELYLRLGYKDVNEFDIDLNQYGTKFRGYGVYRHYGMLREPERPSRSKDGEHEYKCVSSVF